MPNGLKLATKQTSKNKDFIFISELTNESTRINTLSN